ncbi:hypothetical protein [Amycolatopsis nigrescens]|uniref:hypothetical protein n=1 Tax=Amycolatopsis nigrescens TaxID=381445 RepID=UPI0012FA5FF8|nr:hypothetical protein [Amycolatopsis nigrescens]
MRGRALLLALACLLSACTALPEPAGPPAPPGAGPGPLRGERVEGLGKLSLLMPSSPPTVLDAATGEFREVPGAPGGDRVYTVLRAGSTPVLLSAARCAPLCADPGEVLVYQDGRLRSLGTARSAAAAEGGGTADGLWLIRDDGAGLCRLTWISLAGVERDAGSPASCQTTLRQSGDAGLLITVQAGRPSAEDVLIDPATGATRQQFPRIAALSGNRLLLEGLTDFTVLELDTDRRHQLARPVPGGEPSRASPSRDGRFLAVPVEHANWWGGPLRAVDIWVLDLGSLAWLRVPSMPLQAEFAGHALDWSESGALVLIGKFAGESVLGTWRPGEPSWRFRPVALPSPHGLTVAAVG